VDKREKNKNTENSEKVQTNYASYKEYELPVVQ
jgi:hypothetical protein